jgi:hypothetical protein
MSSATRVIVSALLVLGLGWLIAGVWAGEATSVKPAGALPPLKVNRDAPLLLDSTPAPAKSDKKKVDNEACFCCHRNYDGEELVELHAGENIGCMKCHGDSVAHRNDEDHITPPEIMIPTEKIEAACLKCHETHDAPAKEVLTRWQKRCPTKTNPTELVCTDCHGAHRLPFRTVRWDKHTGKFLGDGKANAAKKTDPAGEMK